MQLQNKLKSKQGAIYFIVYSVSWLFCSLLIYGIFRVNGKSFLWEIDGVYQHFSSFNYLCDYLSSLITEHKPLSFFNYTLGQGADILTTLNSYDFTDPISIVSAMIFPLSRPARYTLMIFIKLYLTGLAFSCYCSSIEIRDKTAILAGAIAYTFSGAILYMFARHPNYINWAYFLPFLLYGVETYLRRHKKLPLVLFVLLNIITSYYTFYMNTILVILYVLIHALCNIAVQRNVHALWNEIKKIFQIGGVCSIGVFLSMGILLPTVYAYLINARMMEPSGYTASALHYAIAYYPKLIGSLFLAYSSPGYTAYIGFNVAVIISLILLFCKSGNLNQKLLIAISFFMLCIPMAGRFMNGMGYASNRFSYVLPFYVSVAFVSLFRQISQMTAREKFYVYSIAVTYILFCFLHTKTNTDTQKTSALIMLIWVLMIVGMALYSNFHHIDKLLLALTITGACFQIYFTFSPSAGNYVNDFCDRDKIESRFTSFSSTAAPQVSDEFYRIEKEETRTNTDGFNNVYGTSFFWSMLPSYILDYYKDLALNTVVQNCNFYGLDGRTGLLELASVKYYTRPAKSDGLVPYGYQEIASPDPMYQVFENQYALPIGYTYSSYINVSEYEEMNGIEKEQVMLQSAVLDGALEGFNVGQTNLTYDLLPYEITEAQNVVYENGSLDVTAAQGSFSLKIYAPPEACEIYLYLKGIKLSSDITDTYEITATRSSESCSIRKLAKISNLNNSWPVIRDDVLYNLGCGYFGENIITLKFPSKASFSLDDIQVIAVPMSSYEAYAQKLGENVLEDISVSNDTITGNITIPENRILQFSIPYSIGWTAFIDGKQTEILKSNIMYMAIPLDAGAHTIELKYSTPYLKEGTAITFATLILWIVLERLKARRYHNGRK